MTTDLKRVTQLVDHLGWEFRGGGEYEDPLHCSWIIMERDLLLWLRLPLEELPLLIVRGVCDGFPYIYVQDIILPYWQSRLELEV